MLLGWVPFFLLVTLSSSVHVFLLLCVSMVDSHCIHWKAPLLLLVIDVASLLVLILPKINAHRLQQIYTYILIGVDLKLVCKQKTMSL